MSNANPSDKPEKRDPAAESPAASQSPPMRIDIAQDVQQANADIIGAQIGEIKGDVTINKTDQRGGVSTQGGEIRDSNVAGGDQKVIGGDEVHGDKHEHHHHYPPTPTQTQTPTEAEPPAPGDPPYQGLLYYDVRDAPRFFGREAVTEELVARLRSTRFLAIVGASGSGKSSLVRAGLVAALQPDAANRFVHAPDGKGRWQLHIITPTERPLKTLAASLTRHSESVRATSVLMEDLAADMKSLDLAASRALTQQGGEGLLLVVDQFEELFTLCKNADERKAFVDNLLHAVAHETAGPVIVVLTLRADFYDHAKQFPALFAALPQRQQNINVMSADELRQAIEKPTQRGNWELEAGLVDLLLRDVGNEPGALPLLSHALHETWARRRGRRMTLQGYQEAGGVRGAIAQTAERVFAKELNVEQQRIARNIFVRLTELGEGTQDTRRRVGLSELGQTEAMAEVLRRLADARLVTTDEGVAEVAHEALIREWHTLRKWLDDDRAGLRVQRRLTEAAHEWAARERHADLLYDGLRLDEVLEWQTTRADADLSADERTFLDASAQARQTRRAQEEERQQREVENERRWKELENERQLREAEQQRAESERQRAAEAEKRLATEERLGKRNRRLAVGASSFAVLALLVSLIAVALFVRASNAEQMAFARELAASALATVNIDPQLSILLAIRSLSESKIPVSEEALRQLLAASHVRGILQGHTDSVNSAAYSPNGQWVITASTDGTARVWDATTSKEVTVLKTPAISVNGAAFSKDGRWIATAGDDGVARLWDGQTFIEQFSLRSPIHPTSPIRYLAFAPDNQSLLMLNEAGKALIWDMTSQTSQRLPTDDAWHVYAVEFNPNGSQVALAGYDRNGSWSVQLWDVTGEGLRSLGAPCYGSSEAIRNLAYNTSGTRLIGATFYGACVWDLIDRPSKGLPINHTWYTSDARFSPDDRKIVTVGYDFTVRLWDATSTTFQQLRILRGHSARVNAVDFSPDGRRIVTASADGTARIWDVALQGEKFVLEGLVPVVNAIYHPDGQQFVTAEGDGNVRLWDARSGQAIRVLKRGGAQMGKPTYSPNGQWVAVPSDDGSVYIWDARTGNRVYTIITNSSLIHGAGFSPDNKLLVTAGRDGLAHIWDTTNWREVRSLQGHKDWIATSFFSPDGKQILTASVDGTAMVWDVASGSVIYTLAGHREGVMFATYSHDGRYIITTSIDQTARLWDARNGQMVRIFKGHSAEVTRAAFSPDGQRVVTASRDQTARLWEVATGKALMTLPGHTADVFSASYSPDGSSIITASLDGTARVHVTRLEDLLAIARMRVVRDFTCEERVQYLRENLVCK